MCEISCVWTRGEGGEGEEEEKVSEAAAVV